MWTRQPIINLIPVTSGMNLPHLLNTWENTRSTQPLLMVMPRGPTLRTLIQRHLPHLLPKIPNIRPALTHLLFIQLTRTQRLSTQPTQNQLFLPLVLPLCIQRNQVQLWFIQPTPTHQRFIPVDPVQVIK